jgi:glycosyltransferase involved in cell wall biosynthesis
VVVIAPDRGAAAPENVIFVPARWSAPRFLGDVAMAIGRGLPRQSLLTAGHRWSELIDRAAADHGPFDASVVVLSRLAAWLPRPPAARVRILDAIDSLALSMRERAREAKWPLRSIWRGEERRTAALEAGLSAIYDRVVVVSEDEARLFEPRAAVISNGVQLLAPGGEERSFACGFWGRLRYFANRDAAMLLATEIWPTIRRRHPAARLLIAGSEAPARIRAFDGRDGITVMSPVPDMAKISRDVKVALFPVRYGTGQSNKALEAAEGGCAIVATPEAVRGLGPLTAGCRTATTTAELAALAADLLDDDAARQRLGEAARQAVAAHFSRPTTMRQMRELVSGGGP